VRWNEVSTVPTSGPNDSPEAIGTISVAIGQWAVASAPVKVRTLLGSCVGVVLYDRVAKVGGLAHIVLPTARGAAEHPGKYADTAVPALISDIESRLGGKVRSRLIAKLVGGASMFPVDPAARENSALDIGRRNQETIEQILGELMIPIMARDLGGNCGRRLTLDTASGVVTIKVAGGSDYEI
jgi:chemotaxis protein CheD